MPVLLFLSAFAAVVHAAPAGSEATITFRKIFKSSYPEFVEIRISESGKATFDIRQLDEESSPQPFDVSSATVAKIFQLAGELHNFNGVDLEIHRRIASLGQKTFRYEKGGAAHEVTFNYTLNAAANQLLDIFDGFTRQITDLDTLVRAMKYDRLGVNDALERLASDYDKKLLPEPERLLPALDRLAEDEQYLEIARQRARSLASRIRNTRSSS